MPGNDFGALIAIFRVISSVANAAIPSFAFTPLFSPARPGTIKPETAVHSTLFKEKAEGANIREGPGGL